MRDWRTKLDDVLRSNERDVLQSAGTVERSRAGAHAAAEYEAFSARRRALREAEGAAELEQVASRLEKRPNSKRSRDEKDET